jgi:hypothetical protein
MLLSYYLHSLAIPRLQLPRSLFYSVVVARQKFVLADHNIGSSPTEDSTVFLETYTAIQLLLSSIIGCLNYHLLIRESIDKWLKHRASRGLV